MALDGYSSSSSSRDLLEAGTRLDEVHQTHISGLLSLKKFFNTEDG